MRPTRPRLVLRGLLVAVVALGIMGMHALMSPAAPTEVSSDAGSAAAVSVMDMGSVHSVAAVGSTAAEAVEGAPMSAGGHGQPMGHSMRSMCLAVLAAVVLALVAGVLRRATVGPCVALVSGPRRPGPVRAPPWTVASLPELCLLQV